MSGATLGAAFVPGTNYVVAIYVNGNLISSKVPVESLKFTESGNQQVGSCSFSVVDMLNAVSLPDKGFVSISDSMGQLFKGFINSRTPRVAAVGRIVDVTAHGIESLLDTTLVVSNRRPPSGATPVESDAARLKYFLGVYGSQGLYNSGFGSTDVSRIQTLRASMPTQKFKKLTLRQAIEQVLAVASDTANYYIDNLGRLHTFDASNPEGDAAPYIVRVGTPGVGEIAPEGLEIDFDSQSLVNDYWVNAKVIAISHRVAAQASMDTYGRFAGYVDAPDADTYDKAESVGQAALSDNKTPKVRGSFKVTTPYDVNGGTRWKVGQMVTFYSTQHNLDGAQSRIVGLDWDYISGTGARRVTVRFGGDRLRLRSGGSVNNTGGQVQIQ